MCLGSSSTARDNFPADVASVMIIEEIKDGSLQFVTSQSLGPGYDPSRLPHIKCLHALQWSKTVQVYGCLNLKQVSYTIGRYEQSQLGPPFRHDLYPLPPRSCTLGSTVKVVCDAAGLALGQLPSQFNLSFLSVLVGRIWYLCTP